MNYEHPLVEAARTAQHPIYAPVLSAELPRRLFWACIGNGFFTSMDGVGIEVGAEDAQRVMVVTGSSFGANPTLTEEESIRLDAHGLSYGPLAVGLEGLADTDDDDYNDPAVYVRHERSEQELERLILARVEEAGISEVAVVVGNTMQSFRIVRAGESWIGRATINSVPVMIFAENVEPRSVSLDVPDLDPLIEEYLARRTAELAEDSEDDWDDEDDDGSAPRHWPPRRLEPEELSGLLTFRPYRLEWKDSDITLGGWVTRSDDDVDSITLSHWIRGAEAPSVRVTTSRSSEPRSGLVIAQVHLLADWDPWSEESNERETWLGQRLLLAPRQQVSLWMDDETVEFEVIPWEDTFSAWAWTGSVMVKLRGKGIDLQDVRLVSTDDVATYARAAKKRIQNRGAHGYS